jgi:hypothetical protein
VQEVEFRLEKSFLSDEIGDRLDKGFRSFLQEAYWFVNSLKTTEAGIPKEPPEVMQPSEGKK